MDFLTEFALLSYEIPQIISEDLLALKELEGLDWSKGISFVADQTLRSELENLRQKTKHKKVMESLQRQEVKGAPIGSSNYPKTFLELERPPRCLWYRGTPVWMTERCIGVVGSRNPSANALRWLNWHFIEFLSFHPVTVVSGGAEGIDQRAHALSVSQKRSTVAWMPLGICARYPSDFYRVEPSIIESGGAVVSAFAPNWPIYKSNFLERNELIASQCELTFVVEARLRSGSMMTAKIAGRMGRAIATLPTSVMDRGGMGNLELLINGAALIRDAKDLAAAWSLACPGQLTLNSD